MPHDADAACIYDSTDHDDSRPANIVRLARSLGLRVVRSSLVRIARVEDGVLRVPLALMGRAFVYVVAHELAEWWLRLRGRREATEADADAIAARLVAPSRAVRRCVASHGHDIVAVAHALGTSQSVAALRIAEVYGTPTTLVTPSGVRVRGEPVNWPSERELRRLAAGPLPHGVERVELTDARRRFVFRAA